jgi:hypothetical protein
MGSRGECGDCSHRWRRFDAHAWSDVSEWPAGAGSRPCVSKVRAGDASRRTHRFASRPHKESGESVGCDERPRRRLFRLSSGLSPGSCRESLQVHPRADEVNTGFGGASRWRRRSSDSFNSRHIASVINQVRVKCTSRRMGIRRRVGETSSAVTIVIPQSQRHRCPLRYGRLFLSPSSSRPTSEGFGMATEWITDEPSQASRPQAVRRVWCRACTVRS